jgi:hypothetical protein
MTAPQHHRLLRAGLKVGLVLVSLTVSLAVAELSARVLRPMLEPWTVESHENVPGACGDVARFDECTGWWLKPNLRCTLPHEDGSIAMRTNSAGLRADREYGKKTPGVLRVGVFGDSYTNGSGVKVEDAFVSIIERTLPNVEVLNFGLGAGGPDQSLMALRCKAPEFDLDLVIVAPTVENILRILMPERDGRAKPYFTLADGRLSLHNYPVPLTTRLPPTPDAPPGLRGLLFRSELYQLLLPSARMAALTMGVYKPFTAQYEGAPGELLYAILTAFKQDGGHAGLIFAPLPTYHYIEYGMAPDYERVFRRAAEATGGDYVDLLSAFRRLSATDRRATRFRYDQHYSPVGHQVVADTLLPYIARLRDQSERAKVMR